MAESIFILGLGLAVVTGLYRHYRPDSPVAQYLVPRFLANGHHPKADLRKAGTGWILFSAWLAVTTISLIAQVQKQSLQDHPAIMGLVAFVIPVTTVMLQIVGWYYLAIGIFSRSEKVRPRLRGSIDLEPDQLEHDMRRLTRLTITNISALLFVLVVPAIEALLRVEATGTVILPNVVALITFVLTLGRIRYYLVRAAGAMINAENQIALTQILNRGSIWLAWYDTYELKKEFELFKLQKRQSSSPSRPVQETGR
jgi:hypothetical protein